MKRQLDMVNIDILVPRHDRTSCSDDNLCNSFRHPDHGVPRCLRCYLIDHMGEYEYIEDLPIEINVGCSSKMIEKTIKVPMPD